MARLALRHTRATVPGSAFARVLALPLAASVTLCLAIAAPSVALAQGTPEDAARADALFEEGRALAASGDSAGACAKFEASQKIRPGIGTLFNLADCHEKQGKIALAYNEYLEVAERTKVALQADREKVARERVAGLEARVGRVAFETPASPGDLVIELDGVELPRDVWTRATGVEPGDHVVKYGKRGTTLKEQKITAPAGAGPVVVDISREGAPVEEDDPMFQRNKGLLITGAILGGVGLVSLSVSGYLAENQPRKEGLAVATALGGLACLGVGVPLFIIGLKRHTVEPEAPAAAARLEEPSTAGVYLRPDVATATAPLPWRRVEPGAVPVVSLGAGSASAGWRF